MLFHLKYCFIYLDDIIIFSTSVKENKHHFHTVTDTLATVGIELDLEKLQLYQPSVTFLGFIVSEDGISPPEDKVKPVLDMPHLETFKELHRVLGTINYHHNHLPAATRVQAPLTDAFASPNMTGTQPVP